MEIRGVYILYLILRFARRLAYDYLCYRYFGCQCSIVEKSPRGGSKMSGYALGLTVAIYYNAVFTIKISITQIVIRVYHVCVMIC